MKHESRLDKLEARRREKTAGMTLVVSQDYGNPDVFRSEGNATYTAAQLDRLSGSGVQVVKIVYADEPLRTNTTRYTWEPDGSFVREVAPIG